MATIEMEQKLQGLTIGTEYNAACSPPTSSSIVFEECQAKLTNEETKTTQNLKIVSNPSPFLRLPAEIRNEIYRLVLLTQYIMTDKLKAGHSDCDNASDEEVDDIGSVQPRELAVGTVRCEPLRTYTLRHQVSMLVVNRQIYHEAHGIFCLENFWTIVQVNKKGFAKEMKDGGFPIIALSTGELWCHIVSPVLKVEVIFPSLESQNQSDKLLVATDHLQHLVRALWTAKGASEMVVSINVQSPLRKNSPCEESLLKPFESLRSIKRANVSGVSKHLGIEKLTRAIGITAADGIEQTFRELRAGAKDLQRYLEDQKWEKVSVMAGKQIDLMVDCGIVYGVFGVGLGISSDTSRALSNSAYEIFIGTTRGLAELTLQGHQYDNAISFAEIALRALDNISKSDIHVVVQPTTLANNPSIVVPPIDPLLPTTGTVTLRRETRCSVLLVRARAYIGMRQDVLALRDIEEVRGLMPNSVMLASVSLTWHAKFDLMV